MKPIEEVERLPAASLLEPQFAEEFNHVATGLIHAFGAVLEKDGDFLVCHLENGKRVTVHRGSPVSVDGLWKTIAMMNDE